MCILGVMYIIRFLFRKRSTFGAFCSGIGPVCHSGVPGPGRQTEQNRTGFEHRYHRVGGQIVEVIEFVSQLRIDNMVLAIVLSMLRTDRSLSA